MKCYKLLNIVLLVAFLSTLWMLVDEEDMHAKTRVRLQSYEIKLFECAHSLEKVNKTRPKPMSR